MAKPYDSHNWSGWPRAYCKNCGIEDPIEECVAIHEDNENCSIHRIFPCGEPFVDLKYDVLRAWDYKFGFMAYPVELTTTYSAYVGFEEHGLGQIAYGKTELEAWQNLAKILSSGDKK